MKDVPLNTQVALQNAPSTGLVIRDFVYAWPKNRDTGELEEVGFSTCKVPLNVSVMNPKTGGTSNRDYTGAGQLLTVPPIPAALATEVRKVRLRLSSLSPEAANLFRAYNARYAKIEIHRGHFDPSTGQLVDPATCRFQGYITDAPIKVPKSGGDAYIDVECSSRSRILERTTGMLFSLETLKKRLSDLFGKYLDVAEAWRIWWGQTETVIKNDDGKPHERFIK
jgi:hypothetical protein